MSATGSVNFQARASATIRAVGTTSINFGVRYTDSSRRHVIAPLKNHCNNVLITVFVQIRDFPHVQQTFVLDHWPDCYGHCYGQCTCLDRTTIDPFVVELRAIRCWD